MTGAGSTVGDARGVTDDHDVAPNDVLLYRNWFVSRICPADFCFNCCNLTPRKKSLSRANIYAPHGKWLEVRTRLNMEVLGGK